MEQLLQPRPGNVAPTTVLLPSSITSWLVPRMPLPWVYAPGTSPVGVVTTVTCSPAARASAAVRPTAHTCGSVNVTRGTTPWEATSATSRPRIAAAAMRPWYFPM